LTVTGDATISGNLTVSGTTTYINTTTLNIGDNIITLNADIGAATAPTENAGIEIKRGNAATKTFYWDETNDRWTSDDNFRVEGNVTLSGTIDTGQGATEVYLMNQNVRTTDAVTFATVDTGQGANELYAMNQNVRTTDDVTHNDLTLNGGDLFLSNGTSNRIVYNSNGVAAPTFTSRSAGTKIVLYPEVGASSVDYALGIEGNTMWYSVPVAGAARYFRWYGGTTNITTLHSDGNLYTAGQVYVGGNGSNTGTQLVSNNGGQWNIRAYPRRSDGTNIDFIYSGQSGQPTYVWGTNDGVNMYVWNPSNFSVNFATTSTYTTYVYSNDTRAVNDVPNSFAKLHTPIMLEFGLELVHQQLRGHRGDNF